MTPVLSVSDRAPAAERSPARRRPRNLTLLWLVLPSMILVAFLNAYPVAFGFIQSLQNGTLLFDGEFIGAENYLYVLGDPQFWDAARFTAVFTLAGVGGSFIVGLGLALFLKPSSRASRFFRTVLLVPWVVPVVVTTASWNWLTATTASPLPTLARALGAGEVGFLSDPSMAVVVVCAFKIWVTYPFSLLMMSAALQGVDPAVHEAARVDGASPVQQLFRITLPMIARPILICLMLTTIFCVNDFPSIYLLTAGGPVGATTSWVVLSYRWAFQGADLGAGIAVAMITTVLLLLVSLVLFRQMRKADI